MNFVLRISVFAKTERENCKKMFVRKKRRAETCVALKQPVSKIRTAETQSNRLTRLEWFEKGEGDRP